MAAVLRRQSDAAHGSGAILLDSYGGAINRIPADATAFVHRDALFCLQFLAYWTRPADAARGVSLGRPRAQRGAAVHLGLRRTRTTSTRTLSDWQAAYYGANLARLRDVKGRYDPDRVFRFPQGIRA